MSAGRTNQTQKVDWNTPPKYVDPIRTFFGGDIELDPCSNCHSLVQAKREFRLPHSDGLTLPWDAATVYVNPPYGRSKGGSSLYDWLEKGYLEHTRGAAQELIYLIPVATNTKHYKELVFPFYSMITFLADTRLKFYTEGVEHQKGAPMACALIYLGARKQAFRQAFRPFGHTFDLQHNGSDL